MTVVSMWNKGNVIKCVFEDGVTLTIAVNIEFVVSKLGPSIFVRTYKRSVNACFSVGSSYDEVLKGALRVGYLIPAVEVKESSWIL